MSWCGSDCSVPPLDSADVINVLWERCFSVIYSHVQMHDVVENSVRKCAGIIHSYCVLFVYLGNSIKMLRNV